jgi:cell division protein FtsL
MDSDFSQFVSDLWRYKPVIIVLLVGGFILFVLSVIDTHRHRKKIHKKRHHPRHYNHHH